MIDLVTLMKQPQAVLILVYIIYRLYLDWTHRNDRNCLKAVIDAEVKFTKLSDDGFSKAKSVHDTVRENKEILTKSIQIIQQNSEMLGKQTEILHKLSERVVKIEERTLRTA